MARLLRLGFRARREGRAFPDHAERAPAGSMGNAISDWNRHGNAQGRVQAHQDPRRREGVPVLRRDHDMPCREGLRRSWQALRRDLCRLHGRHRARHVYDPVGGDRRLERRRAGQVLRPQGRRLARFRAPKARTQDPRRDGALTAETREPLVERLRAASRPVVGHHAPDLDTEAPVVVPGASHERVA